MKDLIVIIGTISLGIYIFNMMIVGDDSLKSHIEQKFSNNIFSIEREYGEAKN